MRELRFREVARLGVGILLVTVTLKVAALRVYTVPSESMTPTLRPGDTVLVTPLETLLGVRPVRGTVVVVRSPVDGQFLVKRVLGLPGDHVEVRNGKLWINGQPLPEPYLESTSHENLAPLVLCDDCFFVLGDHRAISVDSRVLGPVTEEDLIGPVRVVIWSDHDRSSISDVSFLERIPSIVR